MNLYVVCREIPQLGRGVEFLNGRGTFSAEYPEAQNFRSQAMATTAMRGAGAIMQTNNLRGEVMVFSDYGLDGQEKVAVQKILC